MNSFLFLFLLKGEIAVLFGLHNFKVKLAVGSDFDFFSFGGSSVSWMKKILFFYIFSLKRDRFVIFVNFAVEMLNFDGILNVKIDFVVI